MEKRAMHVIPERLRRELGSVMILMLVAVLALITLAAIGLQTAQSHALAEKTQFDSAIAAQIAESGAAQALAQVKRGGVQEPKSGGGTTAQWVAFGSGAFFYDSYFDSSTGSSVIEAWGCVPAEYDATPVSAEPSDPAWREAGWQMQGIEITVQSSQYIPETPMYLGNGGIEKPEGGFDWNGSSDPNDPSTWGVVPVSGASSWQDASVPFQLSSLDHPPDYLSSGDAPAPVESYPHRYGIWTSQNAIGQANVEAWFKYSAGSTSDPTTGVTPPPTNTYYDMSDRSSLDYAYPIDSRVPDVQAFSLALWNEYKNDSSATKLSAGNRTGTYGTVANPSVTFVTGTLTVPASMTFEGAGILVVRDEFDPNVDTNNQPSQRASMIINGTFKWSGLVIVAGWAPSIEVTTGGDSTIVGALFGEDSVQSGGEVSLDSATITMRIRDDFRVFYSNGLFEPGGPVNKFLPMVRREIVGIRNL